MLLGTFSLRDLGNVLWRTRLFGLQCYSLLKWFEFNIYNLLLQACGFKEKEFALFSQIIIS